MRWIRAGIVLLMLFCGLSGCAGLQNMSNTQDRWIAQDKVAHFLLSALIAGTVASQLQQDGAATCDAAAQGAAVALALGAAKEWYDEVIRKTGASYRDMVADTLGAGTGALAATDCR